MPKRHSITTHGVHSINVIVCTDKEVIERWTSQKPVLSHHLRSALQTFELVWHYSTFESIRGFLFHLLPRSLLPEARHHEIFSTV